MDQKAQHLTATQYFNTHTPQALAQMARCICVRVGPLMPTNRKTSVPVLELKFWSNENALIKRRFLLDRHHPQRLQSFLEHFLGHPIPNLWELDPETLVGKQGPLFDPAADKMHSPSRDSV